MNEGNKNMFNIKYPSFQFDLSLNTELILSQILYYEFDNASCQKNGISISVSILEMVYEVLFQSLHHTILSPLAIGTYISSIKPRKTRTINKSCKINILIKTRQNIKKTLHILQKIVNYLGQKKKIPFVSKISNQKCPSKDHRGVLLGHE